ncbi:hypothetical protein [Methanospirillum lacunae]|uniref:Uncharacterized protein n=1 Tax=Methanospirillum lacunae TaxID=668570 RepID=A0A2V2N2D0_9EURY|nr:hypothetical protein [Methanospirillum lacunae]PWR72715.1 hypothetical protein DK846_07125 [Methanospirillum lacunae]
MARVLSEKDIQLLKIMAPEFSGETCKGSGVPYKSLLPPIANHYSKDPDDFEDRIKRLSGDDFQYLIDLMLTGEEGLHCLSPEFFFRLEKLVKASAGQDIARKIGAQYAMEC